MRPTGPAPIPASRFAASLAAIAAAGCLGLAIPVSSIAQTPAAAPAQAASAPAPAASRAIPAKTAASAAKVNGKVKTKPLWTELTPPQQQALAPLAAKWDTVSEAQKRKWIALSQNFPKMSAPEQVKLHSRMSEWVALSPQQRTQARLNFAETQQLSPDDKKAKWEAYQALPPEEKRKLAAGATSKPPATAAAVKPVPAEKLATVPKPRTVTKGPRIAAGPGQDDPSASPQQAPAPAAATTN